MKNLIIKLQKISRFFILIFFFFILTINVSFLFYISYQWNWLKGIIYFSFFMLFIFFITLWFIPIYKEKESKEKSK